MSLTTFHTKLLQAEQAEGPIAESIRQNMQELFKILPIDEINDPRTLAAIAASVGVSAALVAVNDHFEEVLN